jgi:hypothetical protein
MAKTRENRRSKAFHMMTELKFLEKPLERVPKINLKVKRRQEL